MNPYRDKVDVEKNSMRKKLTLMKPDSSKSMAKLDLMATHQSNMLEKANYLNATLPTKTDKTLAKKASLSKFVTASKIKSGPSKTSKAGESRTELKKLIKLAASVATDSVISS